MWKYCDKKMHQNLKESYWGIILSYLVIQNQWDSKWNWKSAQLFQGNMHSIIVKLIIKTGELASWGVGFLYKHL